jgi:hypothetical protein
MTLAEYGDTQVLNFSGSDLWRESREWNRFPRIRVTQIFNTNILGGSNIAVGSPHASQTMQVVAGDLGSLKQYLLGAGVPAEELAELETALTEEPTPAGENFGPKVGSWIGRITAKAAAGVWKIAVPAAASLLASAIRWYYGLPWRSDRPRDFQELRFDRSAFGAFKFKPEDLGPRPEG